MAHQGKYVDVGDFAAHGKIPEIATNGARRILFLLIQTLLTHWATQILILIMFIIFFGCQIFGFPAPQVSRFPGFQTLPEPPADKLSDPNVTPLPTHPEIKYVARALAAI